MISAEEAYRGVWFAKYSTGRFWHMVRGEDGQVVEFRTEAEAIDAAREEWWKHVNDGKGGPIPKLSGQRGSRR